MPLPELNITFSQAASNAKSRSDRGILFLIIKEGASYEYTSNPLVLTDISDIPAASGISKKNYELIKLALKGNETAPKKVIVYVIGSKTGDTLDAALNCAGKTKFDWFAIAGADDSDEAGETAKIKDWILEQNKNAGKKVFAVLSGCEAESEYIVNFATGDIAVGDVTYTASEYTARIAGIICGTGLSHSITYTALDEVESCEAITRQELEKADEDGKLVAFWDGEKVKLGRGVNSLTQPGAAYSCDIRKIKISQTKAVIEEDLKRLCEDNYIGKYENNYANRCILLSAISDYFEELKKEGIVSDFETSFDIDAIKAALKAAEVDCSELTDEEIKRYDCKTFVFIKIKTKILDAIEDISIDVTI